MKNLETVYEKAVNDLKSGICGKIGQQYLTVREFCRIYGCTYSAAYGIYNRFKARGILLVKNKAHYINDCENAQTGVLSETQPLIGVHVRKIGNVFYSSLCERLDKTAKNFGCKLVIMSSGNDLNEKKTILRTFLKIGCVGVINLNSYDDNALAEFYRIYPLPFVLYGTSPVEGVKADYVITDNESSGRCAAKHLFERGAKTFIYATSEVSAEKTDERRKGFENYLHDVVKTGYITVKFDSDEPDDDHCAAIANILEKQAKKEKIGIFCHHDGFAATVVNLCNKKNISIPEQAAVIGYDDLPLSKLTSPKLTTFSYSFENVAERCFGLLMDRLKNPDKEPTLSVLPTFLVVRKSTL